ncbi:MAG: ABC transporter permease [Gammaproteobacteria bacterium]
MNEAAPLAGGHPAARRLPSAGRFLRWLAGTLVTVLVTLAGLVLVTFLLGHVVPSDPVLKIVGDHAPQETYDRVYREMRLDRPLPEQFALFAGDMARGRFGTSLVTGNPIGEDIVRFFPATLELATLAIVFGVVFGIPLGVLCARHADRLPDHLARVVSLLGHSMPIFWLGIVGLLVFYAQLGWVGGPGRLDVAYRYTVPTVTNMILVDTALSGSREAFANAVSHIVLPATLLGLVAMGYITRMTRSFLLWQLRQDYTTVLRLKGASESAILWRHVLRNAMIPLVTALPAAFVGAFFTGSLLIETIFSLDGLGLLSYDAVIRRDYPVVLGTLYVFSLLALLTKLVTDIAYTWVDPRVKFEASR